MDSSLSLFYSNCMDDAENNHNAAKVMCDEKKYDEAICLYRKALTAYAKAYKFTRSELDHADIDKECQFIESSIQHILSNNQHLRPKYGQNDVCQSNDDDDSDTKSNDDDDEVKYKKEKNEKLSMQITSDIHLEFDGVYKKMQKPQNKENKASILALLGDIGCPNTKMYKTFIAQMSKEYKYVLIIAGNHEYYGNELFNVDATLKDIASQYENVYFLQKECIEFPDLSQNIRFLGCTLWVNYPKKIQFAAQLRVNDFHKIQIDENALNRRMEQLNDDSHKNGSIEVEEKKETKKKNEIENVEKESEEDEIESFVLDELMGNISENAEFPKKEVHNNNEWGQSWKKQMILKRALNVNDVNFLNEDHLDWIKKEIVRAKNDKKKLIILTHHAPTSYKCISQIDRSENVSFLMNCNSLETMFKYPVIGCFFGHTHTNCDFCVVSEKGKSKWQTRVATNQLGYYDADKLEFESNGYSAEKVISFGLNCDETIKIEHVERKTLFERVKKDKKKRLVLSL